MVVVPAHAQASGLLPDGTSTINQLLAINSGQFFYSEIGVPLSAGTASIFVNIDFGARTIGGGDSQLTVNVPGNVSGTVAVGTRNWASLTGNAVFSYGNTTSVTGLACQTFACLTEIDITLQNANNIVAFEALFSIAIHRADSLGNPTLSLHTGSGTATRNPGLAP